MKNIKILPWNDEESVRIIKNELSHDKVVVGSSDTVFGLLAQLSEPSLMLLNEIKGRQEKPYIILIESRYSAKKFIELEDYERMEKLMSSCWPGPLTLIFKAKYGLPRFVMGPDNTVALRVPGHRELLELLHHFDGLFSTSANLSGRNVPEGISDLDEAILNRVDCVVLNNLENGVSESKIPSTILDCTKNEIVVKREGAYSISSLEEIYGRPFRLY